MNFACLNFFELKMFEFEFLITSRTNAYCCGQKVAYLRRFLPRNN